MKKILTVIITMMTILWKHILAAKNPPTNAIPTGCSKGNFIEVKGLTNSSSSVPSNTRKANCTLCLPGYYLKDATCNQCNISCLECQSDSICTNCNYGHILKGQKCITCPNNCFKCEFRNGLDRPICLNCSENHIISPPYPSSSPSPASSSSSPSPMIERKCISCPKYCEKCVYQTVPVSLKSFLNCTECDASHSLDKSGRCVDVNIVAFGKTFIWTLMTFIIFFFAILFCCPKIFQTIHKKASKSALENMKVYKKLRRKDDDEQSSDEEA